MSAPARDAARVRELAHAALARASVLLPDDRRAELQSEAQTFGAALLPRALTTLGDRAGEQLSAAARSLALDDTTLPRVLGFGWQQADALAQLAAVPVHKRSEVARLGALFNLGIALFDYLCDRFPARAALLFARVTPSSLSAQLGAGGALPSMGDVAVDVLLALIAEFFARSRALSTGGDAFREFASLIHAMYRAERFSVETRRDRAPATLGVWRELRRKSALPLWTMTVLGLLARPAASAPERAALRSTVGLAGDAIWIVDDLIDVREDWEAGCWSRPLWLLARSPRGLPAGGADAVIARLLDDGVAAAEAERLAARLARLRRSTGAPGRPLLRILQATVQSWLPD